ncbi:MAG: DNA2/NAM7 family helicase [Mediterranea sp.]|jgi:hypothetical protein|nr:DNA2/NAM7 family helicase [Mediterranea sp.]
MNKRVRFQYSDDTFLYVLPCEPETSHSIRVRYRVPPLGDAFVVSCKALWRDATINLLDVTTDDDGTLTPAFIIVEPDYLIDISVLAECFKEYGHHPGNYLLSRLQPGENTRQLLLGNIANLFLDEWIHAVEAPLYGECMQKAFRTYPIELATCPDLQNPATERMFFDDCRLHFDHIRRTVQETFAKPGYGLNKADAVLEPSYVCEALGLQGRLDYMQRDMSAFIEMKSGKADEYTRPGSILPRENNWVQMLLYQAVLEYSMGMNHRHVKSYLLYTRYPKLYPAQPSWTLLQQVMEVRNRIVIEEYEVQQHNHPLYTAERLRQISPATLNERHLNSTLWNRYLAPSIEALGELMAQLSPVEHGYFCSLYNFIPKELYLSKTAHDETVDPAETVLYDLQMTENHAADPHRPSLLFTWTPSECVSPDFRTGDAVVLYRRNSADDKLTNHIAFKGNIEHLTDRQIRVRLRAVQQNLAVLPQESLYALEHDKMDTSFRSMYQGLAAFLTAAQERRDLLLARRPPRFDTIFDERIAAATDDFERITLKAQAAADYFLLVGPPGTGKTSRALRGMVEALVRDSKQLLLLSYTNRAVDEICKSLASIRPAVDFIRVGSELACDPLYRPYLMEQALAACTNRREVRARLERCTIFVGTVATLSSKSDLFRIKQFDAAIVDEATQILEPQLLGLLCRRTPAGGNAIGKFILIGDHKQLPAVVQQPAEASEIADDALRALGVHNLKDSLFERLYRNIRDERAFDMLCRQGRMNEEVARFPNEAFYGGKLRSAGLPHQQGTLVLADELRDNEFADILTRRVTFLPSQPEGDGRFSKHNRFEAQLAARLAAALHRQYTLLADFHPQHTLGIITPYRSQIALIRRELSAQGISDLNHILVDTVERFQGSERDVIIYSFCVNSREQLTQLSNLIVEDGAPIDRKLNVVLTRARKQLFLIGVSELLRQDAICGRLIERTENR